MPACPPTMRRSCRTSPPIRPLRYLSAWAMWPVRLLRRCHSSVLRVGQTWWWWRVLWGFGLPQHCCAVDCGFAGCGGLREILIVRWSCTCFLLLFCFSVCFIRESKAGLLFCFSRSDDCYTTVSERGERTPEAKAKHLRRDDELLATIASTNTPPEGIDFIINHSRQCFAARLVWDSFLVPQNAPGWT